MESHAEFLARLIEVSRPLTTRYFAGFNDANRASQAPHLPNHFAWTLGHCALTMHRLSERLDGKSLPDSDFEIGAGRATGSPPSRFASESVAFGSTPLPQPDLYPLASRCVEIFEEAYDRFVGAVRSVDDGRLEVEESWGKARLPMAGLIIRVNTHNSMHSGQLVDLRRALGFDRVVG